MDLTYSFTRPITLPSDTECHINIQCTEQNSKINEININFKKMQEFYSGKLWQA